MILLDANILICAVNTDAPLNRKAKAWLESALSGPETVGFLGTYCSHFSGSQLGRA